MSASPATPNSSGTVFGAMDTGTYGQAFIGYQAGNGNTTSAANNTAMGNATLYTNTGASHNSAFGFKALYNTNTGGDANSAFGSTALYSNTTGANNAAFGFQALRNNTTANYNTAVGYQALYGQTTLQNNVAIGYQALYTGGNNDNVAIGYKALYTEGNTGNGNNVAIGSSASKNTTAAAYNNVHIGYQASINATTGVGNAVVGAQAAPNMTTANSMVAIGAASASGLTTGAGGIYIGASVTASSNSASSELVIGTTNGPTGKGSNTGYISTNGGNVYQGNNSASWATTSDQRLKKNIVDNSIGLSAITQIRVRNFEYRTEDEVTDLPKHSTINIQGVQLGVIAQELQEILPDCVKEESTGVLSVCLLYTSPSPRD